MLPKETVSSEIEKWADTDDKKEFLYKLGVKKADNPILKNRSALLNGTDYTEQLCTSEDTFDWIATIIDKFKSSDPLSKKRIDLLLKMLDSTRKEYKLCNETMCQGESKEWSGNESYQIWKSERNMRIYVCPDGIPRKLYHGNHTYCTIHTDDFYIEGRNIFVSGHVSIENVMNNIVNSNGIFTREDWYKLFTVASSDYNDLRKELDDLKRLYNELLSQKSLRMQAGDESSISDIDQMEAQREAQEYLKRMKTGWMFPEGYGEYNEDGKLCCFSSTTVKDADGNDMNIVLKSYKYQNAPFKINPNEWDSLAKYGAHLFIYTGVDIVEISKDELVKKQTNVALTFSTSNLDIEDKIQAFSDALHYFTDIEFDFESFNVTNKAQSIRNMYNKHEGCQVATDDNDL